MKKIQIKVKLDKFKHQAESLVFYFSAKNPRQTILCQHINTIN